MVGRIVRNSRWNFDEDENMVQNIAIYLDQQKCISISEFRECMKKTLEQFLECEPFLKSHSVNSVFYNGTKADRDYIYASVRKFLKR